MLPALIAAGASALGGYLSNKTAKAAANQNYQHQKQFAQSGIQWKVQDALKAGIHPLYAMGAQTTSFQPTAVGGSDFGLPDAGQNIARAIDATRTTPESALALRSSQVQLEGLQLDNDLKRTQLASAIRLANQTGAHPAMPSPFDRQVLPGQADSGVFPDSGSPAQHMLRQPQFTSNLRLGGRDWAPNPAWSDAQNYEDRYGEMSDYTFGPAIALSDYFYNMRNARWGNPWNLFYKNRR